MNKMGICTKATCFSLAFLPACTQELPFPPPLTNLLAFNHNLDTYRTS